MPTVSNIRINSTILKKLPEGLNIPLEDLTILVGNNGVGKSTLLSNLNGTYVDITASSQPILAVLDTEQGNPRVNKTGYTARDVAYEVHLSHMSHGEALLEYLKAFIELEDPNLLCIDEIESGLSIRNQKKLMRIIRKRIKAGKQFILATHSPVIMNFSKQVFSLDHGVYMNTVDYLKIQK